MGFFNFGNNKAEIQSCALKISTGLGQIEQEYASSNGQATPMVKGIASALQNEVRTLERLLKPKPGLRGEPSGLLHRLCLDAL